MLLLIDPELFKKNSEELFPSDNLKSYLIDDLFECNLGLNEANYGAFLKDGKRVTYLKLSSFLDDEKERNLPIQDYNKRNILDPVLFNAMNNAAFNEINEGDKTHVPTKKLLQPSDFLISIRGRIKGYSMLPIFESLGNNKLVCSNHFVHLKPRSFTLSDMYMPYLHLLLDILVKQMNMNFKESKGSNLTNSLKVDELRKFGINIHNIEEQKKVFEEYEKRHIEFQQANLQYERFMNQLSNSLLNNHK